MENNGTSTAEEQAHLLWLLRKAQSEYEAAPAAAQVTECVPFTETRDYVKKVLANTTLYAALITGQPQSLKARLGMVGPRDAAQAEPNRDLP